MSQSVTVAALAATVTGVMLTGCSSPGDEPTTASPVLDAAAEAEARGLDEQYEILRDGGVTRAEYEGAIDRTLSCLREQGYDPTETWLNPVDSTSLVFMFGNPAAQPGEIDCQEEYQSLVQPAFLATNEPRMNTALMEFVQNCLREKALPVTGEESNYADLVDSAGRENEPVIAECVTLGSEELFPEQELIQISY